MKIKFWGTRGSIPVPDGRMIKYGGNTACVELELDGRTFIVDAGTGIRKLGEKLLRDEVKDFDLFLTHSHWDHIMGFPFFQPIYSKDVKINIFGCTSSYKQLKDIFSGQMTYEYFPVSFQDLKSAINLQEKCDLRFDVNGYTVKTIQLNHPIHTTGLRFEKAGKSFVFITDNELLMDKPRSGMEKIVNFCSGATYLVHDAQYTDEEYKKRHGWGHSTFEQVALLANESGACHAGFFHHDPDRKDSELDEIDEKFKALCREEHYSFDTFVVKEMDELVL